MLIYFPILHPFKQLPKSEIATQWTGYQNELPQCDLLRVINERPKGKVSFRTIPSSEQVPIPTILH